MWTCKN